MDLTQLKYPIGKFSCPNPITSNIIDQWIQTIQKFPDDLELLTSSLSDKQLNWVYRPQGWAIKQIVHHCADSHMNSLIRYKLALTEDNPTIRPYYEDRWAKLPDSMDEDITDSLVSLKGLHSKWVKLLYSMSADDFQRTFTHPESGRSFSLAENTGIYAWHGRHHLAHVQQAIENKGEF